MSAQVFRGRTLADARRCAIEVLGPEAVILTTRTVRRPGLGGLLGGSDVEIAALAREPLAAESRTDSDGPFAKGAYRDAAREHTADISALRAELKGDIRSLKTLALKGDELPKVAAEIAELRELVEALSEPKASRNNMIATQLEALGFEGRGAAALGRKLRKAGGAGAVKQELAGMLSVSEWPIETEPVLIALVGPSGVGKTTTTAKLAARARVVGRSVVLVACDTYRVGAIAQLTRYAELLGVPCLTPRTADELRAILDSNRSDVLIVDTAGRPPTADGIETALAPTRKSARIGARKRHVLLCVPASLRAQDAARITRRFAPLAPTSLVITKIDETDVPAGILHSAWASKLPISVMCNGQRVPEDIAPATVDALTSHFTPPTDESTATV